MKACCLAGSSYRLAMFQTMQQRNQPGTALVDNLELVFDPRSDHPGRQGVAGLQLVLLLQGQLAGATPVTRPGHRPRLPRKAGATSGSYRRRSAAPDQHPRSSSRGPAAPARSPAGPDDARPSRPEPDRSGPAVPLRAESRHESSPEMNPPKPIWQAVFSPSHGVTVYVLEADGAKKWRGLAHKLGQFSS